MKEENKERYAAQIPTEQEDREGEEEHFHLENDGEITTDPVD